MKVKGCVAVVTGGASGLGETTARNLAKEGARVAIFDIAEEKGKQIANDLEGSAIYISTDVANDRSVKVAVDKTVQTFGAIHVLVNCAGMTDARKVLSKEGPMPIGHFNKLIQVNLIGTFNVLSFAAEKMLENKPNEDGERGVIVNTASVAAFEGQIGQVAYSASKAAIVGMTLPLAREFADYGIRVVVIAPGIFRTPMVEGLPEKARDSLAKMVPFPKRLGHPYEFSQLVQHIIENSMLNGEVIRLDGALRMAAK